MKPHGQEVTASTDRYHHIYDTTTGVPLSEMQDFKRGSAVAYLHEGTGQLCVLLGSSYIPRLLTLTTTSPTEATTRSDNEMDHNRDAEYGTPLADVKAKLVSAMDNFWEADDDLDEDAHLQQEKVLQMHPAPSQPFKSEGHTFTL